MWIQVILNSARSLFVILMCMRASLACCSSNPYNAMRSHDFAQYYSVSESHFFVAGKDVEGNSPSALKDETPQTPNSISKVLWSRGFIPLVLLSFLLRLLLIIRVFLKSLQKPLPPFLQELCVHVLRERKWLILHDWDDSKAHTFFWRGSTYHRRTLLIWASFGSVIRYE